MNEVSIFRFKKVNRDLIYIKDKRKVWLVRRLVFKYDKFLFIVLFC